ncbi:uncharacterized protein LOC101851381 [Aplysia californica]|uniref:Uncharacterized protein LOC101851381 n=1 Tax=Aplysia californica TaxID=6500 RepID=A0ABM1A4B8_APLCA|nr:uncharacterized protein LOC101851381 [Aplysia californica]
MPLYEFFFRERMLRTHAPPPPTFLAEDQPRRTQREASLRDHKEYMVFQEMYSGRSSSHAGPAKRKEYLLCQGISSGWKSIESFKNSLEKRADAEDSCPPPPTFLAEDQPRRTQREASLRDHKEYMVFQEMYSGRSSSHAGPAKRKEYLLCQGISSGWKSIESFKNSLEKRADAEDSCPPPPHLPGRGPAAEDPKGSVSKGPQRVHGVSRDVFWKILESCRTSQEKRIPLVSRDFFWMEEHRVL